MCSSHTPRALSNGQKQRTALARALVGSPPLLLLDDPLRNVDAKLRFEMRLELPRLLADQGATVVYVTQDYKEAMALGDRIAVMIAGQHPPARHAGGDLSRPGQHRDRPAVRRPDHQPARREAGARMRRASIVGLSNVQVHLPGALGAAVGRDCVDRPPARGAALRRRRRAGARSR